VCDAELDVVGAGGIVVEDEAEAEDCGFGDCGCRRFAELD
jgi:hypothetical protein